MKVNKYTNFLENKSAIIGSRYNNNFARKSTYLCNVLMYLSQKITK